MEMSDGGNTKLYAVLAIVLIIAAGSIAAIVALQSPGSDAPVLELEGNDGTTHTLTMNELLAITPIERIGSYENSYNNTSGLGTYIGAKISDIISLVGGMDTNDVVIVNATDGYAQTFTYANVYPNTAEYELQGDMVLAYTFNATTIPDYEDGPRIMFLPEDGLFSNADAAEVIDPDFSAGAAGPKLVSSVAEITVMPREAEILTVKNEDTILGFTMTELMNMPSVTGMGGYKRSSGTIVGPFSYTGVPIEYLLNQTENLPVEYTIEVVSDDGYTTYYNNTQVRDGIFEAYATDGAPIGPQEFTLILAYFEGGNPLLEGGPLRVATISSDSYLSDGHFWAKLVVNITLIDEVEPWSLELNGVQQWIMTHDSYYSLGSCTHHRTEVTVDGTVYAGVPLWTLVSSMDGGEDVHYTFNVSLAVAGYNVSLFDDDGAFVNFTSVQLAGNATIIVAGWANGTLLEGDDWPLKLATPEGMMLGNIVRIEMWGFD